MWKWILQAIQIASAINLRRSTILFVLELLKQFERSLVKSDGQPKGKVPGKAGFIYVIRETTNGEHFKIGRRAKPPWRDSQLRSELGKSGDFVLIIPAKDASALEKRLRRAYAKHSKKSEWFSLNESERREILIMAALIQLVAGNDLGMAAVDQDIVNVATVLLNKLQASAKALWKKRQSPRHARAEDAAPPESEPDLEDFSTIPKLDWSWESVWHKDYRALPTLKGKEGYVCFVRDNDAKRGKIFFVNHPVESIEPAFLETDSRFALEIVLVLQVDNKGKAKKALLSPSEPKNATGWVSLAEEELDDIKRIANKDHIARSVFVGPKAHWELETLPCKNYEDYAELTEPASYVCVIQGVNCGKLYKIWTTSCPEKLAVNKLRTRVLNTPRDVLHAPKLVTFYGIIKAKYAESFESFLHARYSDLRRKGGWFELGCTQLEEIRSMGN